ncbi:hypothetical protein MRB53_008959 [Persea americana]|uniref:Uncharacterized protein n=1 Tax=Persea americana TaxID=3435 RepID=A0ACC2LMM2_PERAE|nr:hypothetical protein MRB53_008959 [Persea americana]
MTVAGREEPLPIEGDLGLTAARKDREGSGVGIADWSWRRNPMTEVTSTCSMAMGVWDILREALRTPFRNRKLMFCIALTLLILSSLILLANHFYLVPVIKDLVMNEYLLLGNDPRSSEYTKLLAGVLQDIQIVVAASYSSKQLNLKELILTIARTWKRPLVTSLYIALLGIGYAMLLMPLIVLLVGTAKGSVIFIVFGVLIALLLLCLSIYLGAIWNLGLVISVVEERFSGMKALGRAEELIKGRKLQGFVLSLLLALIYWVFTGLSVFKAVDINLAKATRLVIELVFMNVICLWQLFLCMVFTVFYFQCKKSHGGEVETRVEIGYHLVSTNPQVDASVP